MSDFADQTPYYRKSLDTPKASSRDQFTTELSLEERKDLEALKRLWDFKSDPKVMKLCLEFTANAIIRGKMSWSAETWKYVLSLERQRLSQFKKLDEPTPEENAMQN